MTRAINVVRQAYSDPLYYMYRDWELEMVTPKRDVAMARATALAAELGVPIRA